MAVDPTGEELARFVTEDPDAPLVMLNLLRWDGEEGRRAYAEYSRAVGETFLPRYGGELVYAGSGLAPLVAEDGQSWDAVLLVRYPSRRAFGEMVADPEYREVSRLRSRALVEAVLQPTLPWGSRR
jgi:uncharacterized protein (DUF1330 family)